MVTQDLTLVKNCVSMKRADVDKNFEKAAELNSKHDVHKVKGGSFNAQLIESSENNSSGETRHGGNVQGPSKELHVHASS